MNIKYIIYTTVSHIFIYHIYIYIDLDRLRLNQGEAVKQHQMDRGDLGWIYSRRGDHCIQATQGATNGYDQRPPATTKLMLALE